MLNRPSSCASAADEVRRRLRVPLWGMKRSEFHHRVPFRAAYARAQTRAAAIEEESATSKRCREAVPSAPIPNAMS